MYNTRIKLMQSSNKSNVRKQLKSEKWAVLFLPLPVHCFVIAILDKQRGGVSF